MFGTPSWIIDGEIIHNPETQFNHIGVVRGSKRKIGRSGRALCGEMVLDQTALNYELRTVENFVPDINDLPKCEVCMSVVKTWMTGDWSNLFKS